MKRKSEINEWEMDDQTIYLIDVDVDSEIVKSPIEC